MIYPNIILLPVEANMKGLRGWDLWYTQLGILGQSYWHPRLKEHDQIGRMVSMYLLRVLEWGGVNDVSILKTTDKNDIMQFSVKSKSKTPQFRSNVEIIRHTCLHAE